MKIVSATPDRLEFEHKSWTATLLNVGIFFVMSAAMIAGGEKQPHIHVFGVLITVLFAAFALVVAETSRVVLDRATGMVSIFRKRAFSETRLELPLREFQGAIPEKVYYHKGWHRRIGLVLSDGDETWVIPASRNAVRGCVKALAAEINAWHGTSTREAEAVAGKLIRDARAFEIRLLDSLIRRWIGRS